MGRPEKVNCAWMAVFSIPRASLITPHTEILRGGYDVGRLVTRTCCADGNDNDQYRFRMVAGWMTNSSANGFVEIQAGWDRWVLSMVLLRTFSFIVDSSVFLLTGLAFHFWSYHLLRTPPIVSRPDSGTLQRLHPAYRLQPPHNHPRPSHMQCIALRWMSPIVGQFGWGISEQRSQTVTRR